MAKKHPAFGEIVPVADLGEGPGASAPLILGRKRRNKRRKKSRQGKQNNLPPPAPHTLSSRSGSATEY